MNKDLDVILTKNQYDENDWLSEAIRGFLIALDEPDLLEKAQAETLTDEWHKKRSLK